MGEPRFCYVLMCHTRPDAVLRAVARIHELSPTASILVRHSVPDLMDPQEVARHGGTCFQDDLHVRWGDWTMVEAALRALREARDRTDATHLVLLSGQDYPVRDLAAWEQEVAAGGADAVVDPAPDVPDTYRWCWRRVPGPRPVRRVAGALAWRVSRVAPRLLQAVATTGGTQWYVGTPRRGRPPVPVRKGSLWLTLSRHGLDRWLEVPRERPELVAFFSTTRVPDELYGPSVLEALPDVVVRHGATTCARFGEGASNPDWVDQDVLDLAWRRGSAFVRKLHPDAPAEVVAAADALSSP